MGNEGQEEQKDEMARVHDVEARKDAFMADFESRHLSAKDSEEDKDASTEESATPAVKEEAAASAEKKDESVQTPKVEDKKSSVPEGYVRREALDEERSRRKRLSQQKKDLEALVQELKANAGQPAATQSEDTAEEDEPEAVKALREENRRLKAEQMDRSKAKEQETAAEANARIQKQISDVHKELTEEGYPGFKLGVQLVDQKLREMLKNEEIDEVDYRDPKLWKRVYVESIHAEVAKEFGFATKEAIKERKTGAKQNAAKVSSMSGSKDESKKQSDDEDKVSSPEQERDEYLKWKRQSTPKLRI